VDKNCKIIRDCGGFDKIKHLENHKNIEIFTLAFLILLKFFSKKAKVRVLNFKLNQN